jgi:predicted nuclease with TOPRIM domain
MEMKMTEATETVETVEKTAVVEADKTDWKARAAELEAEATKLRKQKAEVVADRDALKKAVKAPVEKENTEITDYLKAQLGEVTTQLSKYADKAKGGAIRLAASTKLSAMGINPDALELAVNQLDKSLVIYDADSDTVDDTALSAAVSKLKSKHPFLFEKTVRTPGFKQPAEGSSKGDSKVISEEEWNSMSTKDQRTAIKAGRRVQ